MPKKLGYPKGKSQANLNMSKPKSTKNAPVKRGK